MLIELDFVLQVRKS